MARRINTENETILHEAKQFENNVINHVPKYTHHTDIPSYNKANKSPKFFRSDHPIYETYIKEQTPIIQCILSTVLSSIHNGFTDFRVTFPYKFKPRDIGESPNKLKTRFSLTYTAAIGHSYNSAQFSTTICTDIAKWVNYGLSDQVVNHLSAYVNKKIDFKKIGTKYYLVDSDHHKIFMKFIDDVKKQVENELESFGIKYIETDDYLVVKTDQFVNGYGEFSKLCDLMSKPLSFERMDKLVNNLIDQITIEHMKIVNEGVNEIDVESVIQKYLRYNQSTLDIPKGVEFVQSYGTHGFRVCQDENYSKTTSQYLEIYVRPSMSMSDIYNGNLFNEYVRDFSREASLAIYNLLSDRLRTKKAKEGFQHNLKPQDFVDRMRNTLTDLSIPFDETTEKFTIDLEKLVVHKLPERWIQFFHSINIYD